MTRRGCALEGARKFGPEIVPGFVFGNDRELAPVNVVVGKRKAIDDRRAENMGVADSRVPVAIFNGGEEAWEVSRCLSPIVKVVQKASGKVIRLRKVMVEPGDDLVIVEAFLAGKRIEAALSIRKGDESLEKALGCRM